MSFETQQEWNISGTGLDAGKSGIGLQLEGLSNFWLSEPNKYDLQMANDLFQKYELTKEPAVLGKLNGLRLDVMKRAAEGEIARLESGKTRAEIESDLDDARTLPGMKNEKLPYVLVTYLRNVEKLTASREADVAAISAETKSRETELKNDVRSSVWAQRADLFTTDPKAKPLYEFAYFDRESEAVQTSPSTKREGPKSAEQWLDREELLSKAFIEANRKEIDALVAKIKDPTAKGAIPMMIASYKKSQIAIMQKGIGLKWDGPAGADGRFWENTLNALRAFVGEKKRETATKPTETAAVAKGSGERKTEKSGGNGKPEKKETDEERKRKEAVAEALADLAKKEAEAKSKQEAALFDMQKNVVKNLTPVGNDTYVADGSLFSSGFGASFRFDAQTKAWSWLDSPNHSDPSLKNRWRTVSSLEGATVNGKTSLPNFSFNEKGQQAVNAILATEKAAKRYDLASLKSPNEESKLVRWIPT